MKRTRLDTHAAQRRYEDRLRAEGHHKYRRIGRNRKRSREARERDFGDKAAWLKTLPCLVCNRTPSEPHHYPSRGAGGTSKDLVPLCGSDPGREGCHQRFHRIGPETFQATHSLDLLAEAEHYHAAWRERTEVERG